MEVTLDFVKLQNRWFADVPNWKGDIEDLEMVQGADILCEELSKGNKVFSVQISTELIQDSIYLTKVDEDDLGATYISIDIDYPIWICPVTKFVFGEFPKHLYIKRMK